ncbi:jg7427 [Pararge aegeria aegeria]|uniref:Jg7427 protein n=1 Tax=Pararge aegeria aegeria TaxID=348720 RepID=A0A8S4RYY1_9NEOP|nr:jg7427 [Pararge aegeria aegeria]
MLTTVYIHWTKEFSQRTGLPIITTSWADGFVIAVDGSRSTADTAARSLLISLVGREEGGGDNCTYSNLPSPHAIHIVSDEASGIS